MGEIKPPFATLKDLKLRYPDLPEDKEKLAETRLLDASHMIVEQFRGKPMRVDPATLTRIVCDMTIRVLSVKPENVGLASLQMTAGPFSEARGFSNPSADLYLTKNDKKALGLTGGQAKFVSGFPSNWGPDREGNS